jgi:AcrR family transcriptional regulator
LDKTDVKKNRILNAALNCFARYGVNKTTLDDIATAIGMNKASLYYYYENKEAIFSEVLQEEANRFISFASNELAKEKSAVNKLFCFLKLQLKYFRERVNYFDFSVQIVLEMQPMLDKLHREFRQRDIDFLATIIQEGINEGEFRKCDPKRVADAIRALVDALRFRELRSATLRSAREINYKKLENEAAYILNLLIQGIKN